MLLNLDLKVLFKRLTGRRICEGCGRVFNIYTAPASRSPIVTNAAARRGSSSAPTTEEEVIGKRLEVFEAQTKPLIKYYQDAGLLRIVDADADVDTVFKSIQRAVAGPAALGLSVGRSVERLEQFLADLRAPPAREGRHVAIAHRKRLDLPARCQDLGADAERGGVRIDHRGEPVREGLLLGSRAQDPRRARRPRVPGGSRAAPRAGSSARPRSSDAGTKRRGERRGRRRQALRGPE